MEPQMNTDERRYDQNLFVLLPLVLSANNLPLVDMVIHKPECKRKFGLLAGKFTLPDDFMEEDENINDMFYGR